MKSFKELYTEEKDVVKIILDMWRDSADIEDIVKSSKRTKDFIKKTLKKQGKKGWEEL